MRQQVTQVLHASGQIPGAILALNTDLLLLGPTFYKSETYIPVFFFVRKQPHLDFAEQGCKLAVPLQK